mmetsp:Transcript_17224/g.30981  ORF Transcript_17224/g.30981 Transcript_17224/m.30981 type:complete len:155 (+) Transcript_17224:6888-7352(+)
MSVYRRLRKELEKFETDPPANCSAGPAGDGDDLHWIAMVIGPVETPYEGGFFYFDIKFPEDYPNSPPEFKCTTEIFHFNFWPSGGVCLDTLSAWQPTMNVYGLLVTVTALLACPNADSPIPSKKHEAALWKRDRVAYEALAREHTLRHAQPRLS